MGNPKRTLHGLSVRYLGCLVFLCLLLSSPTLPSGHTAETAANDFHREFTLQVLPLLKQKCFGCHGEDAEQIKGEFNLTTRAHLLRGGESGDPAIVPGDSTKGTLMPAVRWEDSEMPPKETDRLDDEQITLLQQWIDAGAPWPDAEQREQYLKEARQQRETDEGLIVETSGGTSDEWTFRRYRPEDLWAWKPVRSVAEMEAEEQITAHPVDHFIDAKREAAGFEPAASASPETLIRRATFDLIGLPPTSAEVEQFVTAWKEDAESAWTKLIDRLLESPQYGENWARHWLDVTRYADTGGMSNDYERSNMWRYRDYVVRSFNADKPYDQFIIEQIAGDELADESVRKRHEGDEAKVRETQLEGHYTQEEAEWIVATGFLRLGPWDNAMVEAAEARQIYLDDLVNAVGQTFLSTTMRCVKCHDHKFDPIPTKDYYRMYAAFATTQMAERNVPFLDAENQSGFSRGKAHLQRMLDFATTERDRLIAKRENAAREWYEQNNLEYQTLEQRKDLPDDQKPPRHIGLDYVDEGQLKVREQDVWIWRRRLERYEPMAQSVYNSGATKLAWNGARKLRIDKKADRASKPTSHVLLGGALTALGEVVQPGVLSATTLAVHQNAADPYVTTDEVSGRRRQLAEWIAHPKNPLTARSIVNRVWQYHFGKGIARNANNFGAKGAKPTHPELLDYLAADFMEHGWTLKRLHRIVMTSATYRQGNANQDQKELAARDPDNELWAYFPARRLAAEEIRDAMLWATGELNRDMGGVPVLPEINMEVALAPRMIQFSIAPAYQPSRTAKERNRRTLYAYRVRGQADPFLELFNQPNPNESCESREVASVTPQAFTLFNSDMMTDRSIAMALRLQRDADRLPAQVQLAFRRILGRKPSVMEQQRLEKYVQDMVQYHADLEPQATVYPTQITRSLVEEFSGKPFEYEEILPTFEDYQPDPKPADVAASTRALADMCLLLFNTHEFMYVR